jgi:hypothetical protein
MNPLRATRGSALWLSRRILVQTETAIYSVKSRVVVTGAGCLWRNDGLATDAHCFSLSNCAVRALAMSAFEDKADIARTYVHVPLAGNIY